VGLAAAESHRGPCERWTQVAAYLDHPWPSIALAVSAPAILTAWALFGKAGNRSSALARHPRQCSPGPLIGNADLEALVDATRERDPQES